MSIREAKVEDAPGIARVHVDSWRTTYQRLMPAEFLAQLSYERREKAWREGLEKKEIDKCYFVAEVQNEIVGFAMGGKERENDPLYPGELYAIYVLAAQQRRGLGAQLIRAVAAALTATGYQAMLVWVLAENPARKFYQKLGGVYVREKTMEIGGQTLIEVAYGWREIASLLR